MTHTVIIPLYNKEDYIGETIAALAKQSKVPNELIVVDDASTDNSWERLQNALNVYKQELKNCRIKTTTLLPNAGPGAARNAGIELATGDLISMLDADDYYEPDFLEQSSRLIEKHDLQLMVLALQLIPSNHCLPQASGFMKEMTQMDELLYQLNDPVLTASHPDFILGVGSNVVVRREAIGLLRYETKAMLNEGIDFWYRVLRAIESQGGTVALWMKTSLKVREVAGSLSRRSYDSWQELNMPPAVSRYRKSMKRNDQFLLAMQVSRWQEHASESLNWNEQMKFKLRYAALLWRSRRLMRQRLRL